MNRVISLGLDRGWRRRTVAALRLPAGSLVLDLACGTGDLCRRPRGAWATSAIGVDFSAGMLAAAHTDAPLVRGDGARAPVRRRERSTASCAASRCATSSSSTRVFSECARVLRVGGRFAALDATVPTNPLLRAGNAVWFRGAVPLLGRVARPRRRRLPLPPEVHRLPARAARARRRARATPASPTPRHHTLTGGSVLLLTGTRA